MGIDHTANAEAAHAASFNDFQSKTSDITPMLPAQQPQQLQPSGSDHSSAADAAIHLSSMEFLKHMVAGAAAGIAEHVVMYPVDTIKTRMQALSHPGQQLHSRSLARALSAAMRREGIAGLYRGVGAVAGGAGPAHALYFATYEASKKMLGAEHDGGHHPLAVGASGAAATIVNEAFMTPADVIKQRLQIAHSPYKGMLDCFLRTWREEGMAAFFKSYRTTLVMSVPLTATHFVVYESAKMMMGAHDGDEGLTVQLLAGGMAGGVSAAVTNPFDVVKTRLQTEGIGSSTRYGSTAVLPVLRQIVRNEGAGALLKGLYARVLFHIPAAAVCWGTYESLKTLLGARGNYEH